MNPSCPDVFISLHRIETPNPFTTARNNSDPNKTNPIKVIVHDHNILHSNIFPE